MDSETLRVTALDVDALERAAVAVGSDLRVEFETKSAITSLRALLDRAGRGKGRIILVPRFESGTTLQIALPGGFNVSPQLAEAVRTIDGVGNVTQF